VRKPGTESALIHGPAVIGWLQPAILLPASAISGLSGQELKAGKR